MSQDDDTLAYVLPVAGGDASRAWAACRCALPPRFRACSSGEITIRVECRQAVPATLRLRVPGYADGAQISVNRRTAPGGGSGGMA